MTRTTSRLQTLVWLTLLLLKNLLLSAEVSCTVRGRTIYRLKSTRIFESQIKCLLIRYLLAAPEILHGQLYGGPPVDIYALGVILYCLVRYGQILRISKFQRPIHELTNVLG
jgi:serine/threonine protein kinase